MKFTDYDKYINSTGKHYISNSGHDERKKYSGGTAGDQTGDEWALISWYNRPWTVVLRYEKDPRVGYLVACLSAAAALNNKIGYDQSERKTYYEQLEKVKFDPTAITKACEDDCTAGTTANCKAAGHILGIKSLQSLSLSTYSKTMKDNFVKAGFTALKDSKYLTSAKYLMPGDILLYEGHHAAANVTIGSSIKSSYKIPNMTNVKVPLTSTPAPAPVITPDKKVISKAVALQQMHLRTEPNATSKSLDIIKEGEIINVYEVLSSGWMRVQYGNTDGYTSNRNNAFYAMLNEGEIIARVTGGKLYARTGPDKSYPDKKILQDGEIVTIYAEQNGWAKVSESPALWSSMKYLTKI